LYDKIKEDEWAGYVLCMGDEVNAVEVLVGKHEGKKLFRRPRRRYDDIVAWSTVAMQRSREGTCISRRLLGKQVSEATNMHTTIEVVLNYNNGNGVFCGPC
jgi:hypothetical protein